MNAHKIDWSAIPWTPVRQGVEQLIAAQKKAIGG